MLRPGQQRVAGQQLLRGIPGLGQQRHIAAEVGGLQRGQAVLAAAEEVAGTPQLQVLLGNAETASTVSSRGVYKFPVVVSDKATILRML